MLQQPHLLIAGATGAGKSVLMHHLIDIILLLEGSEMILIDTKKVELYHLKHAKNTLFYADNVEDVQRVLKKAVALMDSRFRKLRHKGLKKLESDPVYIIIDEYADLVLCNNKLVINYITKIATLGRAANIHLILGTQRPTADIVNKRIAVNITARVCLRVATATDSRNVLGVSGGELLPAYGRAIYWLDGYTYNIEIPPPTDHAMIQEQRVDKSNINHVWFWIVLVLILITLLV